MPARDALREMREAFDDVRAIPAPTVDRFKVSSMALLEEHAERHDGRIWPLVGLVTWPYSIPVFVDDEVEAGWIEAWLGDALVDRVRLG